MQTRFWVSHVQCEESASVELSVQKSGSEEVFYIYMIYGKADTAAPTFLLSWTIETQQHRSAFYGVTSKVRKMAEIVNKLLRSAFRKGLNSSENRLNLTSHTLCRQFV